MFDSGLWSAGMASLPISEPLKWSLLAACKGLDAAIFFPDEPGESETHMAKAVCSCCPVVVACLEYALTHRELDGIWGGHSELDRRRVVRERRRAAFNVRHATRAD